MGRREKPESDIDIIVEFSERKSPLEVVRIEICLKL
jgi:predicted nucleotidyltransferase